jgi:hypothetical protein
MAHKQKTRPVKSRVFCCLQNLCLFFYANSAADATADTAKDRFDDFVAVGVGIDFVRFRYHSDSLFPINGLC